MSARNTFRTLTLLAFALSDCATIRVAENSPQEGAVFNALHETQAAYHRNDRELLVKFLQAAKSSVGTDPFLLDQVADVEAGWLIESQSLEAAATVMADRLRSPRSELLDQGIHDRLIFLCEARHDQLCALLEAMQMMHAAERLPPPWPIRLRLGNLWQQAHTLRGLAQTLEEPLRSRAILYAQQTRSAFEALARESKQSLPSIAILTEQFASLDGDCPTAVTAAHSLDPAGLDPQDLYITSAALDACGRAQEAEALRQRILSNDTLGLFPAAYRFLARSPPSDPPLLRSPPHEIRDRVPLVRDPKGP